jgi:hypothetical protein
MGVKAPALPLLVCAARQPRGSRAAYEQPAGAAARWLARGALHVLGILLGQQRREHAARDSGGPCYSPPSPIGPRDSGGSRYISQPYPLPLDQRAGRGRCGLPAPGQAGLTDRVPTGHQHPAATNPRLRPHATPPSSTGERGDCGLENEPRLRHLRQALASFRRFPVVHAIDWSTAGRARGRRRRAGPRLRAGAVVGLEADGARRGLGARLGRRGLSAGFNRAHMALHDSI